MIWWLIGFALGLMALGAWEISTPDRSLFLGLSLVASGTALGFIIYTWRAWL